MALWRGATPLVLASASTVRRAVLTAAGIPIDVKPADVDERAIEAREQPADAAVAASVLAREKARAVAANLPGRIVLGADQTLALGIRRFSKPQDRAGAREQLQALSGQTHMLHSAVAIARDRQVIFEHVEVARLTMRVLSEAFIDDYLDAAGAAVTASVGAYQVEHLGIHLFERIEGDHFTILGLPLLPVLGCLRRERFLAG